MPPVHSLTRAPHSLGDGYDVAVRLAEGSPHLKVELVGQFEVSDEIHKIIKFIFINRLPQQDPIRIGVFGGLHGDEPASWEGIYRLVAELATDPSVGVGFELHLYPVCNPSGLSAGTRLNSQGLDLNREFWKGSSTPEVSVLEEEIISHEFQGMITLHADDTAVGMYGYTHGRLINEALVRPALAASGQHLPRDTRPHIDGFQAHDGLIKDCFKGILSAPCSQKPQPFDIIFETPALAPLPLQIEAASTALRVTLAEYRKFVAYAQDL